MTEQPCEVPVGERGVRAGVAVDGRCVCDVGWITDCILAGRERRWCEVGWVAVAE